MGGWKQKSGWIQIPPASCVPFTFPFLSQLSVCLIVSRVRAYLTTDQQYYTFVLYCHEKHRVRHIRKKFRRCLHLHRMASRKAQKHKVVHFCKKYFYVLNDQEFNI